MNNGKVLCSISTRGRYDTTLPLTIQSIMMQTRLPDKLVIFDDNDPPQDLLGIQVYQYLFTMMTLKGMKWQWLLAEKKGQHFNHDKANRMGFEWVWRMDDDTVAEPDVLEKLMAQAGPDVGAVGGSILTPPLQRGLVATGKMEDFYAESRLQHDYIAETRDVDHLHCSFLYRAGVVDYNLSLSRVAHREETFFTYGLKKKGYRVLITPAVTWHLRNHVGGIRDGVQAMYEHDEKLFVEFLSASGVKHGVQAAGQQPLDAARANSDKPIAPESDLVELQAILASYAEAPALATEQMEGSAWKFFDLSGRLLSPSMALAPQGRLENPGTAATNLWQIADGQLRLTTDDGAPSVIFKLARKDETGRIISFAGQGVIDGVEAFYFLRLA